MLVFPISILEQLMDYVQEIYVDGDLPEVYTRQVQDDPWHRWFAYDVARNHLRMYQWYFDSVRVPYVSRLQSVSGTNPDVTVDLDVFVYLNNRNGPEMALYPDVMYHLSTLEGLYVLTNPNVRSISIPGADRIGMIGSQFALESEGIVYLDIIDSTMTNTRIQYVINNIDTLEHLHMDLLEFDDFVDIGSIDIPNIKYLSITRSKLSKLLSFSQSNLDYFRIDQYSSEHLQLSDYIHEAIGYVHIQATGYTWKNLLPLQEYPRLSHLGLMLSSNTGRYRSNLNMIADNASVFPALTSIHLPCNSNNMRRFENFPNLIHLSMDRITVTPDGPLPTSLKYIKTLNIVYHDQLQSRLLLKSWNIPSTSTIISISRTSSNPNDSFTTDMDLSQFTELVALMIPGIPTFINWLEYQIIPDDLLVGINEPQLTTELLSRYNDLLGELYYSNIRKSVSHMTLDQIRELITMPLVITDHQILVPLTNIYIDSQDS